MHPFVSNDLLVTKRAFILGAVKFQMMVESFHVFTSRFTEHTSVKFSGMESMTILEMIIIEFLMLKLEIAKIAVLGLKKVKMK